MNTTEKIVNALKELPSSNKYSQSQFECMAKEISIKYKLKATNERVQRHPCDEEVMREETEVFYKKCAALRNHILMMHKDTMERIDGFDHDPQKTGKIDLLPDELECLMFAAIGRDKLIEGIATRLSKKYNKKGLKQPVAKTIVADYLLEVLIEKYTKITGKKATRIVNGESRITGNSFKFVKNVFAILNIKGSPENRLKEYIKKHMEKNPKK